MKFAKACQKNGALSLASYGEMTSRRNDSNFLIHFGGISAPAGPVSDVFRYDEIPDKCAPIPGNCMRPC